MTGKCTAFCNVRVCACMCVSLGLCFSHRGEVCRHSKGQRAETHGPTAAATDSAAQCCLHVGKSDWTQQPGTTVPCSECVFSYQLTVLMGVCMWSLTSVHASALPSAAAAVVHRKHHEQPAPEFRYTHTHTHRVSGWGRENGD